MPSRAIQTFDHAIEDAIDLLRHFDALNTKPPPPQIEVLNEPASSRRWLLGTYFEDRLVEASEALCASSTGDSALAKFPQESLANNLQYVDTPSADQVRPLRLPLNHNASTQDALLRPAGSKLDARDGGQS